MTLSNKTCIVVFHVSIHAVSNICLEWIKHHRTVLSPTAGHPELNHQRNIPQGGNTAHSPALHDESAGRSARQRRWELHYCLLRGLILISCNNGGILQRVVTQMSKWRCHDFSEVGCHKRNLFPLGQQDTQEISTTLLWITHLPEQKIPT